MDKENKNPDITELYIKNKELSMLLKRYENLNKQYIDLINKNSSKEEIDNLNNELNEVNGKLIGLSNQLQLVSNKLKSSSVTHANSIKDIEIKIENLMPILYKEQSKLESQRKELIDSIGQEENSEIVEESSNLQYVFLFLFALMMIAGLIYSFLTPTETRLEIFIFSIMSFLITHQIVQAILHKIK
jgi:hypothetical protein